MSEGGRIVGGRYRILTEIGCGGMSTVYLALDTTLSKQWAIKEIRHIKDNAEHRRIIDGLVGEANLIKTFDHPAIPRIVDLIEEHGSFFIVMDYVEGQTLAQTIASEGKQTERTVISWGIQLCDTLDYLHERTPPMVYRDMKPSNVMVTPEGAIRVIDFGIACEMPPEDGELPSDYEPRMGTPGFAAPEQYDEHGRCSARTDVYSLGALLYVLLVGEKLDEEPYDLPPIRQMLPEVSAGLERVLAKALHKDPEKRYGDCAAMAYDLEHAADKDAELRRSMRFKWHVFCALCAASVVFLITGGAVLGAGAVTANSSYEHHMDLAGQAVNNNDAEAQYVAAAGIRSSEIGPYNGLIKRYESDGILSDTEHQQLQQLLSANTDSLQRNGESWGQLAFSIGKLYWYYYTPSRSENGNGNSQMQHVRMQAAEHWMKIAGDYEFKDQQLAVLYLTIANFETTIVPLINEGEDQGKYAPYFKEMMQLSEYMKTSNNDVMRLSTANLILNAVRTYPRKFRADGVSQKDLEQAVQAARRLAQEVSPATDELRQEYESALGAVEPAQQAVSEAFIDITGKGAKR